VVIGIPISLKMGCVLLVGWVKRSVRQREVFQHLSSDERFATQHLGLKPGDFALTPPGTGPDRVSSPKESRDRGAVASAAERQAAGKPAAEHDSARSGRPSSLRIAQSTEEPREAPTLSIGADSARDL
jgi:hypothetical protein